MSSRCALRITEQGEAGPPAFTAFLGLSRAAAGLGEHHFARSRAFAWCEHRCARSSAWGACGAPLRPGFGLICLEHISVHPPCCAKHVHERHESPFFGWILTLVYTFWVRRCAGFESLARYRKSPGWVTGTGFERLWRRERDSRRRLAPPSARAALRASLENAPRFLSSAPSQGSNPSPAAEKSPHPKRTQARHPPWRRERDSNPRDAHAPNGFQDRRIQPLCHLSVVGNDSIEYRPA